MKFECVYFFNKGLLNQMFGLIRFDLIIIFQLINSRCVDNSSRRLFKHKSK